VSQATINRDINILSDINRIAKTHGGAMSISKSIHSDIPLSKRSQMHHEEKTRIARAPLDLLKKGRHISLMQAPLLLNLL